MADRRDWGGGGDDPEESTQFLDLVEVERQLDLSSMAARLRLVRGRRSRVRHVIGLRGLNGEDHHSCIRARS
ncbi:hypothetical protein Taro_009757, partial [Colocasia esculenta]|nr:hypothetical protein [Colocasia esculenta]